MVVIINSAAKYIPTVVYVLSLCALSQASKHGIENGGDSRLQHVNAATGTGSNSVDMHVHMYTNLTPPDQVISLQKSECFVRRLFREYSDSNQLSLDGFARILCTLGLVPIVIVSTKKTDNFVSRHTHSGVTAAKDCKYITFEYAQRMFDKWKTLETDRKRGKGKFDGHLTHGHENSNGSRQEKGTDSSAVTNHDHNRRFPSDDDDYRNDSHKHDANSYSHDHNNNQTYGGSDDGHNTYSFKNHSNDNSGKRDNKNESNAKDLHSSGKKPPLDLHDKVNSSQTYTNFYQDRQHLMHAYQDHSTCSAPKDLLEYLHIPLGNLTTQDFRLICPALLFQLDSEACRNHSHNHIDYGDGSISTIPAKVWGYGIAAVTVISLMGLLGTAVIPVMQKVFYNHFLQFLVAMGVGALSGDALLYLLPHAISIITSHDSRRYSYNHIAAVWKGLVALLSLFFFFLMERILTLVTERRHRKKDRMKRKRCGTSCHGERSEEMHTEVSALEMEEFSRCDQTDLGVHSGKELKDCADTMDEVLLQRDEALSQGEQALDNINEDIDGQDSVPASLKLSHSHSHGHVHDSAVPSSVSSVACLVIIGIGVHNFSDGLAIGASFAYSIPGGIGTSIAICCHELYSEIGDFAVLLQTGMSMRRAIVYSCISSVLSLIGMLIGVAIGNIHNASLWIMTGIGGMFLYISLVDMLPEMTKLNTRKRENQLLRLLLQVCGMMVGGSIMFVISFYEHDLQQLL